MKLPKSAQCDEHENRAAVVKIEYAVDGIKKLKRACINCGDVWFATYEGSETEKNATFHELTQEDLRDEKL